MRIVFFPPVLDKYVFSTPESVYLLVETVRRMVSITEIELEIIRFLAENGVHSASDMFKGPLTPKKRGRPPALKHKRPPKRDKTKKLSQKYKKILRHVEKLEHMGLLQSKRKKKYILALTFDGFHIYLQNTFVQEPDREAKHLDEAITANSKLLPFAKYWNEIVRIVGKNVAHRRVAEAIQQQIYRYPVNISEINLKFDSFLTKPKPFFPKISKRKQEIELADFMSKSLELRNSYIAYLAIHDIFYLTSQKRWSEIDLYLDNLESEKALAFFEKRNIRSKPLFVLGTRLKEFLPRFATIEYFFTGMLMKKLFGEQSEI